MRFLVVLGLLLSVEVSAGSILITNAALHTMRDDAVLNDADILINDGVIEAIGTDLESTADRIIDAAGMPVTPALFAGVTSHGLTEVGAVSESVDGRLYDVAVGNLHPEFDVKRAYTPHSSLINVTRIEGFGYALLAASSSDSSVSGTGSMVEFDGGYESFSGKSVLYIDVDGRSSRKVGGSRAAHWMELDGAMADLSKRDGEREYLSDAGSDALKRLKRSGVFVFDAYRAADIRQVIAFAEEHDIKAMVHGATEAWMVADELADAGIPIIVDGLSNLPSSFDSIGARLDNAALSQKAGVTVLFSSGETHNARKIRQGVGTAVAHGLPYDYALRALTTLPSELLDGPDRSVRVGSIANLTVWSGDPLEVTSYATSVIIDGNEIPMVSRQQLLLERYLPRDKGQGRAYIKP